MKPRILIGLFILITIVPGSGQQVYGLVMYQNSGGQPADGVEVSAFGCSSTFTQSNGMFALTCNNKRPGQKIRLVIGKEDASGKSIEVVNTSHLNLFRVPDSPDDDPLEIIVCPAGNRDEAASKYYNILSATNNKVYERELKKINNQLAQKGQDEEVIEKLLQELEELEAEQARAEEKIEEQAEFIASINQDQASEMVKTAIQKIEQEEDVESALSILDVAKLEESYQLALEKKAKAEAEMKQVVEGYKLRISMLMPRFEFGEIAACYNRVIDIYESNNFDKEELAKIIAESAKVQYILGNYMDAQNLYVKSLTLYEGYEDPQLIDLAGAYTALGLTNEELGKLDTAIYYHTKAIDLLIQNNDTLHPGLSDTYNNIALAFHKQDQNELALEYQKKSLHIDQQIYDPGDLNLAASYHNISLYYNGIGDYDQAIEYENKSIEIKEARLEPNDPNLAYSYSGMAEHYRDIENLELAMEYQTKALSIREKVIPNHPVLAISYNDMAVTYRRMGKYQEALDNYFKALEVNLGKYDSLDVEMSLYYNNIGVCYRSMQDYEKAMEYHLKAMKIREQELDPMDPDLGVSYISAGITLNQAGRFKEAIPYLEKTRIIRSKLYGEDSPRLESTLENLGLAYINSGMKDKAESVFTDYEKISNNLKVIHTNWTSYYAFNGKNSQALDHLKLAIENGFSDIKWMENDPCLDKLRGSEEFVKLLGSLKDHQK